jgi:nucleotide-binding universal stress UspA family protein
MQPFHKILVPTDFSACSDEALRVAAQLSRTFNAPLTVMTVYQPVMVPVVPEGVLFPLPLELEGDVERVTERLRQVELDAAAAGAGEVRSSLRQGAPFDEIIASAREGGFDLIVMGTHGHSGLKHALLGSVAEKVVRKAPCAVLTVRMPDPDARPDATIDATTGAKADVQADARVEARSPEDAPLGVASVASSLRSS